MATQSKQKQESIPYVTPFGIARYPKISAPDLKGKFADNKYKTDLLIDEDQEKKARVTLTAAAQKLHPGVPVEDIGLPLKEFFSDKEKTKSEGFGLVLKSQYKPAVFDAKKQSLPDGVKIGAGSELRVASFIFPWQKTETQTVIENGKKTKQTITAYGVGLRLGDVQVRKLVEHQNSGDGSAFDETEGFEYEATGGEQFNDAEDATSL